MARQQRPVPTPIPASPTRGATDRTRERGIIPFRPRTGTPDQPSRSRRFSPPARFPLRPRTATIVAAAALAGGLLGGCSLLPAASATPAGGAATVVVTTTVPDSGDAAVGIVCPDAAGLLTDVPADAQAQVDRELAGLENQIAEAGERLVATEGQGGPNFVQNAVLGPLSGKRTAALDRIRIAIERVHGDAPDDLTDLAVCSLAE